VRAQRETQLAIAARRVAFDEAERKADAAARRWAVGRVLLIVALIGGLAGGGWYANRRYRRVVAADAALATLASPYVAAGFQAQPRPIWQPRGRLEAMLDANTCVVALASTSPGTGKLLVVRPSGTLTATTSLAYCTCADEHVTVRTEGDAGGVELLRQEARLVGGNGALAFLTPRPAALPVSDSCAVDPLDAWLAAGHGASPATEAGVPASVREALASSGFKLTASAPATAPFAVVPGAAETCFVATSTTPGEALSLRIIGGKKPLSTTAGNAVAIAWCSRTAAATTVLREGTGSVVVYRVGSASVAGTMGLRQVLALAGFGDVPIWVKTTELGWDASAPLVASGVALPDITLPRDAHAVSQASVVSLTLGPARVAAVPDEIDRYLCAPALETKPRDALCVQSSPLGWVAAPGEVAGIAEAPLPFWMDIMTHVDGRAGLALELQLLTLSRKLRAQHYEATARTGVTEERAGVVVDGRAGDDRIIAIGLMSTAPWVLPYTDGEAWTLDGEPHSIALGAGERRHLVTLPSVKAEPDVRHTVVFRHRVGP
jgi:hypothetical protein